MAAKPNPKDWEIPAPSPRGRDPWAAPTPAAFPGASALSCHTCGDAVRIDRAFAKSGDLYCAACAPAGAVSGAELPTDPLLHPSRRDEEASLLGLRSRSHPGNGLVALVWGAISRVLGSVLDD